MHLCSMFYEDINYRVFYLGTVLKWITLCFQVCVVGIEYVFILYFCECCLLIPPPHVIFFFLFFFLILVGATQHVKASYEIWKVFFSLLVA
jgi:hypothetical protein